MISWKERKADEKEYGATAPYYEGPKAASPAPQQVESKSIVLLPVQDFLPEGLDAPEEIGAGLEDVPAIQRPSNQALHERRTVRCPNCAVEWEP
jgi:hypothetical protein